MLDPNSDSDLIIFPGLFIFILRFHEKLCEWYAAKRNIKDYCCIHNFKVFNISVYLSENQQDNSNTPQMEMDSKTSSENIDNLQAEGPRDQTVSPEDSVCYPGCKHQAKQGKEAQAPCDGGAHGRPAALRLSERQ